METERTSFFNEDFTSLQKSAEYQQHIQKTRKLLQQRHITLFHGNKDANMIPCFGKGKSNNDFGKGFYTTPDANLGKEWAYSSYTRGSQGFLHEYNLDLRDLKVLNLVEHDTLSWMAELYSNRELNYDIISSDALEIVTQRVNSFVKRYKLNTDVYDVIVGYRADDSYFRYANDFALGLLYRETLDDALMLGDLGLQVFIKSEKAFSALSKVSVTPVDDKYAQYYIRRDKRARAEYEEKKRIKGTTLIFNYI